MYFPLKLYGLDKNKQNNSWKLKGVFVCKFQYYTFVLESSQEKYLKQAKFKYKFVAIYKIVYVNKSSSHCRKYYTLSFMLVLTF